MTRTAGAPIGCQRPSRFWGLGCPKIYHEAEDTLVHDELLRFSYSTDRWLTGAWVETHGRLPGRTGRSPRNIPD
ncbi:hypothetical protein, partial [Thiolapillus sp.]|uniref:hypothetical protein n=1 Tax=Thiolapillus sp. TaxID=2017437 RepID=UPI003AF62E9D